MPPLNMSGLPRYRFTNKPNSPIRIFMVEGDDFMSSARGGPYEIELYQSIQDAISEGVIQIENDTTEFIKGVFDDDTDAVMNGLVEGDVYELSQTNTLNPAFYGLLKVVRLNALIIGYVLGSGIMSQVLGTGNPDEVLGY